MVRLAVSNLTFSYGASRSPIFDRLNFDLVQGSFNLLIGPSGSGKSTLFKLLAGLYPEYGGIITTGTIQLNNQEVSTLVPYERARHIALLFQNPSRQFAMRTVEEQLTFALENLQLAPQSIPEVVTATLRRFNLESFRQQQLLALSGGEQQRIALATTIAMGSDIILLDEPFANVDQAGRQKLLTILKELQVKYGKTIFICDHDLTGYQQLVDHLYEVDAAHKKVPEISLQRLTTVKKELPVQNRLDKISIFNWQKLSFKSSSRVLLKPHSFQLPKSQVGLLSGANGSGKSTLFAALSHQLKYQGAVYYKSKASERIRLKRWAQIVGVVFQNSTDQFIKLEARAEINLSRQNSLHPLYWTDARITAAIKQLQLTNILDHVNYQLSGGQQKKLQVLSMLIMAQPILLFDEPLAGLDAISLKNVMQLIKKTVTDLEISSLLISHQRAGVTELVDYELLLANQTLTLEEAK
ncbi:ABC transporter ATP-binding protein [Liquorilactobacillus capillatus]|uniref:ABC transporter ATP-binding protein n=1 Tax=Liquorilactobacillus capillatus DSM 19910 TaxID=1423731 RepID=A0A0R1LZ48_9LACO|nr:ABC transporter ATP-binding protein [Liquorilactobacillus capillatus]KRL00892.1 ABC transporter ATP-binding protein [Liquorilactobacillus capillatus DSM 19910]